jgi:DNA repair exonuclease SbcCD nuclease subunit
MTAPLRIIHAADCHLDAPCRSLSAETRAAVDRSARSAFEDLVTLAIDRDADALVIAGDLLDGNQLRLTTGVWLADALARATAAGITVVVTTGNHDPSETCSALRQVRWPDQRFHLAASAAPATIPIARADGVVVGMVVAAGHEVPREARNLVAGFARAEADVPTIGVVHAHASTTRSSHDRYAPCDASDLARPGYAYWALGHVHRAQHVPGDHPTWYSGCLQGRDFGETGAKGALEVEVAADRSVRTRLHPLARVRWEEIALGGALGEAHDTHALVALVAAAFRELQGAGDARADQEWVLRVRLGGPSPLHRQLAAPHALAELASVLTERLGALDVVVVDDGITGVVDVAAYRDQDHVLGLALAMLDEAGRDDGALELIAPAALAGGVGDPEARRGYLRALLVGLDHEVATALLAEATT